MLQGLRRKIGRYAASPPKQEPSFSAQDKPQGLTPFEDALWRFRKQHQDLRRLETELTQMLTRIQEMSATMATVAELFSAACSDDDGGPQAGHEYKSATKKVANDEAERLEQSIRFTVLDPLRDRLERHAELEEQAAARDKLAEECKTLRAFVQRLPTLRLEDDDKRAQAYSRLDAVTGELVEAEKQLLPLLHEATQANDSSSTENLFNTMRLQTAIFFSHASQLLTESLSSSEKIAVTESSQALESLASLAVPDAKLNKVSSLTSDGWTDVDGSSSSTAPDGVEVLDGSEEDEDSSSLPITLEEFEAGKAPPAAYRGRNDTAPLSVISARNPTELVALASHPVVQTDSPADEDLGIASDDEWSTVVPSRRKTSPSPRADRFVPTTPRRSSSMFWSIRKSIRGKFSSTSGESRFIRQTSAPAEAADTSISADSTNPLQSTDQPCVVPQTQAEWETIEACLWELDAREAKSPAKPFLTADPSNCNTDDMLTKLLREHEGLSYEYISYLRIEDLARLAKVNYRIHSRLVDCDSAWKKCIRSGGISSAMRTSLWLSVFYESTPWRSNGIASHHLSAERRRNMYEQLLSKVGTKLNNGLVDDASPSAEDTQLLVWLREIDVDVVRTCHRSVYTKNWDAAFTPKRKPSSASSAPNDDESVMTVLNELIDKIVETSGEEVPTKTGSSHVKIMDSDLEAKIRRVLRAYVVYNPRVGYCQGMGFLVRLLAEVTADEADIFWLFVGFSEPENDRNLYEPGMAVLQPLLTKFEMLFSTHMPELYAHFQAEGVHVATFCTRWFLTFFSSSETLAPTLVVRLLDIFIVDGWRIIFTMSLVVLDTLRDHLLHSDLEGILRVLQFPRRYMAAAEDCQSQRQLIRHALAFSMSRTINSI